MLRSTLLRISAASILLLGLAFAQPSGGPATQAVVGFMNVLDHPAVLDREPAARTNMNALALALLEHLENEGILAPPVSEPIRTAIPNATVDRNAFVLFLGDLLNHTDPLDTVEISELETRLASTYCGLRVPVGSTPELATGPLLDSRDVSEVVRHFTANIDCIAPKLRDSYGEFVE
jgi:hypothetical protein